MNRGDSPSPDSGLLAANSSETSFSQSHVNSIAQSSNGEDRGTALRFTSVVRNLHNHHADLSSPRVVASSCPSPSFPAAYATTASAATATATAPSPNIASAASTPPSTVTGTSHWSSSSVGNSASNARGRNMGMVAMDISPLHPGAAAAAAAAAEIPSPPPYLKQGGRPQASNFMAYTPSLHHNSRLLGGSGGRVSTGTPPYFNGYPPTGGPSAPYPLPAPVPSNYGNCNGGDSGSSRQFAGSAATSPAPASTAAAVLAQQQYRPRQQQQPEQRGQAEGQSQGQGQDHNNQDGHYLDVLQDPAVVVLSSVQPPPAAPHEPWSPGALYFRAPWLPTTLPPVIRLHLGSASSPSPSTTSSSGGQCYEATLFPAGSGAGSVAARRAQHPAIAGDAKDPPRQTVPSPTPKAQASKSGSGAGAETESGTGTGIEATLAPLASQSSVRARVLKPNNNRRKRQVKNRVKPEDLLTETRFCSCCGKYKKQDQFDPERLTCERCRGRA